MNQRVKTWLAVLLIPVLMVGLGLSAKNLTTAEWNKVVNYNSKYTYSLQPGAASQPLSSQVVLIIVDGLRADVSYQMPVLNELRKQGAQYLLTTGQPSLSTPGAAVLASGTYQEFHGVTTNWYEGALKVDSIEAAAKRAGLKTGVAGGKGWDRLVGPSWDEKYYYEWSDKYDDLTRDASIKLITQDPQLNFILVHYSDTDEQGHAHGGASPEYLKAALGIDARIGEFLEHVDLTKTTVIVTADHGHIDSGGHGGWEPEVTTVPVVMAGKGIVTPSSNALIIFKDLSPAELNLKDIPGVSVIIAPIQAAFEGQGGQGDVPTTIAALLGTSFPANTVSQVLWQALDLSPADRAAKGAALAKTELGFTQAYLSTLGRTVPPEVKGNVDNMNSLLAEGRFSEAATAADKALTAMDSARTAARAAMVRKGQFGRLPVVLVLALLPLLLALALWRKLPLVLPAVGGAVLYFIVYNLLFFVVHGYIWSLSAFNSEDQIMAFFNARMLEAALTAILAALALGVYAGAKRATLDQSAVPSNGVPWYLSVAHGGAMVSFFIAYGLFLQVLLAVLNFGLDFTWYLPNLRPGFKFYLDLLQGVTSSLAAVATPLVAMGGAALGRLLIPRRKETSLKA
ncbi:MAG: alkaline phosphatase family protein [Bacillota bacterium]